MAFFMARLPSQEVNNRGNPPRHVAYLVNRQALLVIDVQNDFISGTLAVPTSEGIVPIINNMRDQFDCDPWL